MLNAAFTRRRLLYGAVGMAVGASGLVSVATGGMKAGDRPKSVSLSTLSGESVTLPDTYTGKVLIVHFWASWCPSCWPEIDALGSLFGEQSARGLLPVSVNIGETKAAVADILRPRKVLYPILLDEDSSVSRLYGVTGIPTTFVFNRTGTIEFKIIGEVRRDGLRRLISRLL
jgi:cytochrome c biogenesis protein CcmG, thiol:disulfide interchange protein DsbE